MVRVGIVGGTGYTALELIRLLLRHPEAQITRITSRDPEPVSYTHLTLPTTPYV